MQQVETTDKSPCEAASGLHDMISRLMKVMSGLHDRTCHHEKVLSGLHDMTCHHVKVMSGLHDITCHHEKVPSGQHKVTCRDNCCNYPPPLVCSLTSRYLTTIEPSQSRGETQKV